jgi:alkylation response protein AidB-like acyl-CoA dehydrogenase
MNDYRAPVERMLLALETAGLGDVLALPEFKAIDTSSVADVLEAFGRLAGDVIAPTNRVGDTEGAHLDADGRVVVPAPLAAAYAEFVRGGWIALAAPEHLGGGGFPKVVATALSEMFCSANMALSLNPVLTQSAVEALTEWGTERQRELYLRPIIDGSWTGTMNLTEPDAGSDVGALRSTATPLPDGRYAISGTKIFITWGDHELASNIVHLVLARLPGAPAGTKGISLFIVPKYLVGEDGTLGERNGVHVLSLEHKLGIHASPTCVLEFDGAIGELIGPEHNGMAAMFSMMNPARLAIGVQGVALGERAFQQAIAYAQERRQGRAPGATEPGPSPIVEHPDVQRMLARIAVGVDAARLLTFATAVAADVARHHPDETAREAAQRRVDLLTPLAKAWPTDLGNELTSLALQVHGGMGYVEETGAAQLYRDARIAAIYEGTNGIQAIDLVGRKLGGDRGAAMHALLAEIATTLDAASDPRLATAVVSLRGAHGALTAATDWIVSRPAAERADVLAAATAYLELAAVVTAGHLLLRQTLAVLGRGEPAAADREVARMALFAATYVERARSLAPITIGATTYTSALGMIRG